MPRLSCTVTVAATGLASENVTVAASACPSPSGLMLDGSTVTALVARQRDRRRTAEQTAGRRQRAVAGRVLRLDAPARGDAREPRARPRPSARPSVQATLEPVPALLAIVVPAASSTRTVHESDPESVAAKRTGYDVSGARLRREDLGQPARVGVLGDLAAAARRSCLPGSR